MFTSIFLMIIMPSTILKTEAQVIQENDALKLGTPESNNTTMQVSNGTTTNNSNIISLVEQVNMSSINGTKLIREPPQIVADDELHPDPEAFEIAKKEANLKAKQSQSENYSKISGIYSGIQSNISSNDMNRIQLFGFEGMNFYDGFQRSPPDVQFAVGPNSQIEMINLAVTIWIRNGCCSIGQSTPIPIYEFFDRSSSQPFRFSDPRIFFDDQSGRYFLYCRF